MDNIKNLSEKYPPLGIAIAITSILVASLTTGEDAMLSSVFIQLDWCKTGNSICLFSWHIGIILVVLILGIIFQVAWLEKIRERELSSISLDEYYDYPLPLKSGIVIYNKSERNQFKNIEIELLKVSWHKKDKSGEVREIIRKGVLQNNSILGKWENGKCIVSPNGHEAIYFIEIVDNKIVLFLNHQNQEYKNEYFFNNVAESMLELIFVVRGFIGEYTFNQRYSSVFEYRSTKIVPSKPAEIISTVDIKSLIPIENDGSVF